MKRFLYGVLLLLLCQHLKAQREYFLYLQSDDGQPFYLRMNDKTWSSTASGYLILSKMRDSSYTFRVGWPGKPDQQPFFTVAQQGRDRGLLLKNFGADGWGLFDWQTLQIIRTDAAAASTGVAKMEPKQVSAFTDVLSRAANDPSLRMREVKEQPAADSVKTQPSTDIVHTALATDSAKSEIATAPRKESTEPSTTTVVGIDSGKSQKADTAMAIVPATQEPVRTEEKERQEVEVVKAVDYSRTRVSRKSESSTTEGFSVIYNDVFPNGTVDTIRITIPPVTTAAVTVAETAPATAPADQQFLDIEVSAVDSVKRGNDCPSKATEPDFLRTRKRMAAETADDGMLKEARKAFDQKCYSVKQVRNLGMLFLNDAARFQFFELASRHVSDLENFGSLGEELKNEYYLRRFRAVQEKL